MKILCRHMCRICPGLLFLSLFVMCSCIHEPEEPDRDVSMHFDYPFDQPDLEKELPKKLKEISGLTFTEKGELFAIQDEDGILFQLDPESGEVIQEKSFGDKDDYEGLAYNNGIFYITDNKGNLAILDEARDTVSKLKTRLKKEDNTEGLTWDPVEGRLLIACKDAGGAERFKYIHTIDTSDGSLSIFMAIDLDEIGNQLLEGDALAKIGYEIQHEIAGTEIFRPSGIAIHPLTDQIFILSSRNNLLAVYNREKDLEYVYPFPGGLFSQPEGIAFDSEGNLFIASEAGKAKSGKLVKFKYRK